MTPEDAPVLGPPETKPGHKSGFVAVLGLPNVGKSTLINCFMERDPLIVSYKPQTTRFQVRCISTNEDRQIVFVDTPGWHAKGQGLGKYMRREISRSLEGADVLLYLVDASRPEFEKNRYSLSVLTQGVTAPLVLAVNKMDEVKRAVLAPLLERFFQAFQPREIIPISALKKENLIELDRTVTQLLPEGPMLYPPDIQVDKPDGFLFGEFIREQLYFVTKEEIPFSCAVEIESVDQSEDPIKVAANILVERDSQKGILIGAGGNKIAEIRRRATKRISQFAGKKAELELRVKVRAKWSQDERFLDTLGHNV